jgi:hypothetical protein
MLAELNVQVEDLRGDHGVWHQHAKAATDANALVETGAI